MDASTAALLGASIGVVGTVAGALINPFTAARHARNTKIIEMRRDAYLSAIESLEKVSESYTTDELSRAAIAMRVAAAHLLLFTDKEIFQAFEQVRESVVNLRRSLAGHELESIQQRLRHPAVKSAMTLFEDRAMEFIHVARSQIGIH